MEKFTGRIQTKQIIAASALFFIGIAIVIALLSEPADFWGLVGLLALPKVWLGILAVISALVILFSGRLFSQLENKFDNSQARFRSWMTFVLLVLAALFWMLRSQNLILGDGLLLIDMVHSGKISISAESFTLLIIRAVSKIAALISDSPVLLSFRIVSIVAGIVYAMGSFLLSKILFAEKEGQRLGIVSFWTLGVVQLFFGYVENYSLPVALAPWLIYFTIRYIEEKSSILAVAGVFALMCAFHLVAVSLGPAILYLLYINVKKNPFYKVRHVCLALGVLTAVMAGGYFLGGLKGHVFIQLTESERYPYSLLSGQFWSDMLNEIILTSSFSVFLLILAILFREKNREVAVADRAMKHFALIGTISVFLFSMVMDPKLGTFRDWDLKGFFALPLLVTALAYVKTNKRIKDCRQTLAAVAMAFVLMFTLPWVLYNNSPVEESVAISSAIIEKDIHYSTRYDLGSRMGSMAVLLTDPRFAGYDQVERLMEAYLKVQMDNERALHLLVYAKMRQGKFDEAFGVSERLHRIYSENSKYILQTAHLAVLAGEYQAGLDYLEKLRGPETAYSVVVGIKAQANYGLGNLELAEEQFQSAYLAGDKEEFFLRAYAEYLGKKGLADYSLRVKAKADSLGNAEKIYK